MAKKEVELTEVVAGIKIEVCPNASCNMEHIRKAGFLTFIADACNKHGFKRAVVGTMGDMMFGYMGASTRTLSLDSMHVVKFLKR